VTGRSGAVLRDSSRVGEGSRPTGRVGADWRPGSRAGRRVQRRRRSAGLLRFALFLLLVFLASWAGVRVAQAGTEAAVGESHVTAAGDTLWKVALEHYGDAIDPRRAVYEIRVANHLAPDRVLQPGDRLVLPRRDHWGAAAASSGQ
jgi:hypothetical protein